MIALAGLLACAAELAALPPRPPAGVATVYLASASLPAPLSAVAVHTWFVVRAEGEADLERWEVWQTADGSPWGHVQRDAQAPFSAVGGGPTRVLATWTGPDADAFTRCLRRASPTYAYRDRYVAWPGPNSNTYVAAMLRACGLHADLPRAALGQGYR